MCAWLPRKGHTTDVQFPIYYDHKVPFEIHSFNKQCRPILMKKNVVWKPKVLDPSNFQHGSFVWPNLLENSHDKSSDSLHLLRTSCVWLCSEFFTASILCNLWVHRMQSYDIITLLPSARDHFVTGWQQPPVSHVSQVSWLNHFLPPFHVIPCPVHTQTTVPMSGKKLCQVADIERKLKVTKNGKGGKSVPAIVVHHSGLSHSTTAEP